MNGYAKTEGDYIPPGWDSFVAFVQGPSYYGYTIENFVNGVDEGLERYKHAVEDYSTEVITQDALDFLNTSEENDSQPFFLYFTPYAPHAPATPPKEYENMPANIDVQSEPSYNEADVSDKSTLIKNLPPLTAADEKQVKTYGQPTAGALKALDDNIGKILNTLEANGELENTIIIYTSDNGLQWGEHHIPLDKDYPYEESAHVHLVIYDGRVRAAGTVDEFALNIDLAPTILDLAGISIPDSIDGKSLKPLLEGNVGGWRSSFLTEGWGDEKTFTGIHQGQWSYMGYGDNEVELYDLEADPYQLNNLAKDDAYADILKILQEELACLKECKGKMCS